MDGTYDQIGTSFNWDAFDSKSYGMNSKIIQICFHTIKLAGVQIWVCCIFHEDEDLSHARPVNRWYASIYRS